MSQLRAGFYIALVMAIAVLAVTVVEAQVNFSPSWGKRASVTMTQGGTEDFSQFPENCKIPLDSVVRIQKLIQLEAHKLMRCETLSGDVQRRK
ncbi:unnamed protein product [Allacma fusca]|uniref:Adipokinetic hormone 1 n=1 Tax=Allacma fusca TaxID=39272 RepID=A0A8J2KNQ8_9HEXA|nr:unnamed protein product [Allacma fusca]